METIYILFVLIVALTGLVGLRKEGEKTLKESIELASDYFDLKFENKDLEESITAFKGWGSKYREDIEYLKIENRKGIKCIETQADTIRRMRIEFDGVHILLEKLIVSNKKARIQLVNDFTFKK